MLNHALASRSDHTRLVSRCLSAIVFASATSIAATACHDAATSIMAPTRPAFAVSGDGTWLVNSLADPGDGACSNNECTLREAIAAAQTGDRITFKSNLSGTIALAAGELGVDKSLTIEGPGASSLILNGQTASAVLRIGTVASGVIATISGLTVTGGKTFSEAGGITVMAGSRLVLLASVLTGNRGFNGGGIYNHGSLTLVGTTVAANQAAVAGGGVRSDGILTVIRSTISGNSAGVAGGGIFAMCGIPDCGSGFTLRSSTITKNEALDLGGGVHVTGPATMMNTIIAGNVAKSNPIEPSADCAHEGTLLSLGYNLSTLDTGCPTSKPIDVVVQSASLIFTAVLEFLLADNGSMRPTHALIERGYAVDAGYCPGENGDQRGFPRPYDDLRMPNALDGCDIGAFEWQPLDTKIKGLKP